MPRGPPEALLSRSPPPAQGHPPPTQLIYEIYGILYLQAIRYAIYKQLEYGLRVVDVVSAMSDSCRYDLKCTIDKRG